MPQQKPHEVPLTQPPMQKSYEVPLQVPQNLQNWPRSCQRLHLEVSKCDNGWKTCNQNRVAYWRKHCEKDEPHGQ